MPMQNINNEESELDILDKDVIIILRSEWMGFRNRTEY